jgi:hypothetical protein
MASAKPVTTTRKSAGKSGSRKSPEPEISSARWAGVALVIAALFGAIVLAVVSPSDPASEQGPVLGAAETTPIPVPSASADTRLPTAQPEILIPTAGSDTGEWEIEVTVDVPKDSLRAKELSMVVLRGDDTIGEAERPKTGGKVVVPGVRLVPGLNELTAALKGPGGLGPRSEPITVMLDNDRPELDITSPANKTKTFEDTITVEGVSEPGVEVTITNPELKFDTGALVVGPDGTFGHSVPLKKGRNAIAAESEDAAGQTHNDTVVVTRKDGKPTIKFDAPKRIDRSTLPAIITVGVLVTDVDGAKMPDAAVVFSLIGTGRPADGLDSETNANGRSKWQLEIAGGSSPILLVVEVTSPHGQTKTAKREIVID